MADTTATADGSANELPPEETKAPKPQGVVVPVSIMGGLRIGGAVNLGQNAPDSGSNPNGAIGAVDLAIELGSTVFDHFYGGLILGGDFFISPQSTTSNVSSFLFGTQFGYITNPQGFGGYFGLGVAYRAIFVTDSNGDANKYDGVDVLFTAGLHAKIGPYLRLIPRADLSLGAADGVLHAIVTLSVSIWLTDEVFGPKRRAL